MAGYVAARDMERIALEHFVIEAHTIKNLSDAHRENRDRISFDLLCIWRNKTADNTKEVSTLFLSAYL